MATTDSIKKALAAAKAAGHTEDVAALTAALSKAHHDKVVSDFETSPLWKQFAQGGADLVRLGTTGASFGLTDKYGYLLGGGSPDEERQLTEDAKTRSGIAGDIAEIGGAVVSPVGKVGRGVEMAKGAVPAIKAAAKYVPKLLARPTAKAIGTGGAMGVADAFGHDKDLAEGGLTGSLFGVGGAAAGKLITKGASKVAGFMGKNVKAPSVEQLTAMKDAAYKEVHDLGVNISPNSVDDMIDALRNSIKGARPIRHPQAVGMLDDIVEQSSTKTGPSSIRTPKPLSLYDIDAMRQAISRDVSSMADGAEAGFGKKMVGALDNFLDGIGTKDVMGHTDPKIGVEALKKARGLNSRVQKLDQVSTAVQKAERRNARSARSDIDTKTRQNLDQILGNKSQSRGFSPDELKAMEGIVYGSPAQNTLSTIGRLSPDLGAGGLKLGAAGVAGGMMGGPMGALAAAGTVGAAGYGAKKASEKLADNSIKELMELIAAGGKKSALDGFLTPTQKKIRGSEKTLSRALTAAGVLN